jgi:excinuclease ABC subunit A
MDVIKTADWVIDLGPEGGDGGGRIVAAGTPEEVSKNLQSHTGRYLRSVLTLTNVRTIVSADEPGSDEQGRAHAGGDPRRRAAHRQ